MKCKGGDCDFGCEHRFDAQGGRASPSSDGNDLRATGLGRMLSVYVDGSASDEWCGAKFGLTDVSRYSSLCFAIATPGRWSAGLYAGGTRH